MSLDRVARLFTATLLATAVACGDDEGNGTSNGNGVTPDAGTAPDGGGGDAGTAPADSVEGALNALGVDTTETPRSAPDGTELGADHSPADARLHVTRFPRGDGTFGTSFAKTAELYIGGVPLAGADGPGSLVDDLQEAPVNAGQFETDTLFSQTAAQAPFLGEASPPANGRETLRAAAAADVDGDGAEELVFIYYAPANVNEDESIRLRVVDDETGSFAEEDLRLAVPADVFPVASIIAEGGDFDGDGRDEVAVAISRAAEQDGPPSGARLLFIDRETDAYALASEQPSFGSNLENSSVTLRLAAGNVDWDVRAELAVVVNETDGSGNDQTRYAVLDDLVAGAAELSSGRVEGVVGGTTRTMVVADVALGDLDGDRLDEVVFAGLSEIRQTCEESNILIVELDDAPGAFAQVASSASGIFFNDCPAFNPRTLAFVHVNTLNIDDDEADELQVSRFVFDGVPGDNWPTEALYEMFGMTFEDMQGGERRDAATSAVAVADVTGDGIEDIITYRDSAREASVWGKRQPELTFGRLGTIATEGFDRTGVLIVPVDAQRDGQVLQYSEGEYELVFTEPIIVATLAAPPCQEGIGQNLDVCQTTYGRYQSTGAQGEAAASVSAAAIVGIKADGGVTQLDASFKTRLETTLTAFAGLSYQVTKTVNLSTGSMEDTVIFTTIPLDQYTYTVTSHPDPSEVGKQIVMSLPREPLVLQVERSFYNAVVEEDAWKVDGSVYQHTIGNISTYPTRRQRDELLAFHRSQVESIRLDRAGLEVPVPALEGLTVGPESVGQGNGSVELALDIFQESAAGAAIEVAFSAEVEATAGVIAGFSVGASVGTSLTISRGRGTSYVGAVGNLPTETFSESRYQYGLFTYLQVEPTTGKEFEVINYWVE